MADAIITFAECLFIASGPVIGWRLGDFVRAMWRNRGGKDGR